jgi:hypothetical protein
MAKKSGGIPKDVNQNAARIVALTTGQDIPTNVNDAEKRRRSEAASILGKLGGSKGGKMRAANLSPGKRRAIAKKAAAARWEKRKSDT